ncbi:MAG TPA: 2-C-methyl-D-erythritol 2,4-cyclodiphosphate synthase, partial [Terriglobus sp.]
PQEGTAVAHVTVLLESIPEIEEPKKLVAEMEDPLEMDVVVRTLIGEEEPHNMKRLGRKPTFDTDDLT